MSATNDLFVWYFQGYSGMGGWTIFLVLAVLAVSALIADSQRRRFRASGWLLAAILLACLIVPSVIYSRQWQYTVFPSVTFQRSSGILRAVKAVRLDLLRTRLVFLAVGDQAFANYILGGGHT